MDRRKPWKYRQCTITPRTGGPRYFGRTDTWKPGSVQYRTRWWRVRFVDGSWVFCTTKQECQESVDRRYPRDIEVIPGPE